MSLQTQDRTKTLPASQVKNSFGAIVSKVQSGTYDAVIVENRGEPAAAIVPVSEVSAMQERKEAERRREALAKLREARAEVQSRLTKKLTDTEAMEIADQVSYEIVDGLAASGTVRFERDASS
jgi:prevent-host-death family protein